jgi:DNA ligase 1
MLLADLVDTSRAVAATRSRAQKTILLADALRTAEPAEVETVVAYLSGELRQRRTGIGWRSLQQLPPASSTSSLTVADVHERLQTISELAGAGSQAARAEQIEALFSSATGEEQQFLARLITGEVRQGALDGIVVGAVAEAADVPIAAVRRAVMLRGASGPVAAAALEGGAPALERFGLEVGQPVRPMLAASAPDVDAALTKVGEPGSEVAVEWKLDGIRVQVHRTGDDVRVFTRSLDDITSRVPEVVELALELPVQSAVLDGEAIALDARGRALPFQQTGSRTASSADVDSLRREVPLSTYLFDLLHLDGTDVLDQPAAQRMSQLRDLAPPAAVVPRLLSDDPEQVRDFFADAVAHGHEGVVVKGLDSPYEAGRRGSSWVKVKPRHTLDLVVLAAEWGHGRRQGWLSNLHLGARTRDGDFAMLGKTFKGMTDDMLVWQTERLLGLETSRAGHVVSVRPELVVEIAFDGVQTSTRYPAGMALRFARVLRYREDKTAEEADTVDTVRQIHQPG